MAAPVYIPGWIHFWLSVKQGNEMYHYHYSYVGNPLVPPSDAELLQAATDIYGRMCPALATVSAQGVTYVSGTVRDMSNATGREQTYVPVTPTAGLVAADPEPANVAGVMSYVPSVVGKGVRGRTYVSALPDTMVVGQVLASSVVTALANIAASLRT